MQQKQNVRWSNVFYFLLILPCLSDPVIRKYEGETAVMTVTFENVHPNSVAIQFGNGQIIYRNGDFIDLGVKEGNFDRFRVAVVVYDIIVQVSFTIEDISRNDGGTYKFLARRKESETDQTKIAGLMVRYPPGEAECEILANDDTESEMEIIRCSALRGNIPGKFVCFQNEEVVYPISERTEKDVHMLRQYFQKKKEQTMQCCSAKISTHIDMIDIEECDDSILPAQEITDRLHKQTTLSSLSNNDNQGSDFYDSPVLITDPLFKTSSECVQKSCECEWNYLEISILSVVSLLLIICITNSTLNYKIYQKVKSTNKPE